VPWLPLKRVNGGDVAVRQHTEEASYLTDRNVAAMAHRAVGLDFPISDGRHR
jgi:hypothetical protein